jgi:hypothetical protein
MPDHKPTGNAGEHLVASQVDALGFNCELFRQTDHIDGDIQFGEAAPGQSLRIQVKTGQSHFHYTSDERLFYRGENRHLAHWVNSHIPVILCLVDLGSSTVYWQVVTDATVISTGDHWKVQMPLTQTLTATDAPSNLLALLGRNAGSLSKKYVDDIQSSWKRLGTWEGNVQIWARYSRVASEPTPITNKATFADGKVLETLVGVTLELTDFDEPQRRAFDVPDPDFRARLNDSVAIIYAGRRESDLRRIALVNLDAQYPYVDFLRECNEWLYPVNIPARNWIVFGTMISMFADMIAMLLMHFTLGLFLFFGLPIVGLISLWGVMGPRREFMARVRLSTDYLVEQVRRDQNP